MHTIQLWSCVKYSMLQWHCQISAYCDSEKRVVKGESKSRFTENKTDLSQFTKNKDIMKITVHGKLQCDYSNQGHPTKFSTNFTKIVGFPKNYPKWPELCCLCDEQLDYAPVNGNPHPPPHPGEIWGIRQLKGKKEEKAPPYGGKFLVKAPSKGLDFSRFVNIP